MFKIFLCFLILTVAWGCEEKEENFIPEAPTNSAKPAYSNVSISTDKAAYSPNENVTFTIDISELPSTAKVRYKYLDQVIAESPLTSSTWTWKAPPTDFRGYTVEIYTTANNSETIYSTIAVDVSSDWKKFPRYGFVSKFPDLSEADVNAVVSNLNRHHINGVQFYDWHNKHHMPLPMNGATPANSWKDIMNRDIYLSTIQKYINSVHSFNMKAMQYNLVYGAWENAETDGLKKEWYVYKDNTHSNVDVNTLGAPFLSSIYLLDPTNGDWQQHLINENKKIYENLNFDGFHMDQLGDRGMTYNYSGAPLILSKTFKPFINAVKAATPNKYAVFNAVNQYGQQDIAESASDFLYTEVWSPFETYNDLSNLIKQNNVLSHHTKNSVLAAYINYDLANRQGFFNTPSVLMTNAVIFAFGGSHLELGEHMLGKEYFANDNLTMKEDLKRALVSYYDFLVAYQNLLRDGGTFNSVSVTSIDNKMNVVNWPATSGSVATVGKQVENKQVIHFINFNNSKTQSWRDNTGIQAVPMQINDAQVSFAATGPVKKIWYASPDVAGGSSRSLNFTQNGDNVSFTLPELQYWSMIVVEY